MSYQSDDDRVVDGIVWLVAAISAAVLGIFVLFVWFGATHLGTK